MPQGEVGIGIASTYRALATATVVDGGFTTEVVVPADMEPGEHHIQILADGAVIAQAPVVVTAAGGPSATPTPEASSTNTVAGAPLASTGGTTAGIIATLTVAMALLVAGGLALLRRRRTS